MDKTWHTEHFFCAQCGQQFGEDGFHERDGKPYCRNDYFDMFAPKCNGCNRAIMENYISALNSQWHPDCFVCRVSNNNQIIIHLFFLFIHSTKKKNRIAKKPLKENLSIVWKVSQYVQHVLELMKRIKGKNYKNLFHLQTLKQHKQKMNEKCPFAPTPNKKKRFFFQLNTKTHYTTHTLNKHQHKSYTFFLI